MFMDLLLVDYISVKGHKNFNKIHIESLLRLGCKLHLVGRKGQFDNIDPTPNVIISYIPERLFKHHVFGQLTERLYGIMRLWWINIKIKPIQYDATVFLIYDILSMFFFRNAAKIYLVNHNNVSQLSNCLKYWMTRHLPAKYTHITLNEEMEKRLRDLLPEKKIKMVPHGICAPISLISKPPFVLDNQRFLFCPVNRNYDNFFVKNLFESKEFKEFLHINKMVLFLKESMPVVADGANVVKIEDRIDLSFYNYLLKESVAVILPYGSEFKYRSSGILFECVARNKPILATNIDALAIYKDKVEMRFFEDATTLVTGVKYYLCSPVINNKIELFKPDLYWTKALANH